MPGEVRPNSMGDKGRSTTSFTTILRWLMEPICGHLGSVLAGRLRWVMTEGHARRLQAAEAIDYGVAELATPEYNYSVPSALKNAIEWGSVPHGDNAWEGKPAAIMGASANRMGTARAQYHLRQIFVFLNIYPVNHPEVMIPDAKDCFNAQGELVDENLRQQIKQLLQSLVAWTRQLRTLKAA